MTKSKVHEKPKIVILENDFMIFLEKYEKQQQSFVSRQETRQRYVCQIEHDNRRPFCSFLVLLFSIRKIVLLAVVGTLTDQPAESMIFHWLAKFK